MNFFSKLSSAVDRLPQVLGVGLLFLGISIIYLISHLWFLNPQTNELSYSDNHINVLDLSIPANLEFCGEPIPTNDFEIKEDLKKEFIQNAYWRSNSALLFHKVQRWFPYIEPILKQEGIPDDFKYLAVIESHLSNVRSGAGAAGFWQLVPTTAINYGLQVDDEVDERFHVEKATRAACFHIKEAYKIFHNWTLSAAAYNRGINGLIAAIKNQKTKDYHELLLNKETGSFVYRILAYKTLLATPSHFGIKKKKWHYYPKINYKWIKVDSAITNLSVFVKSLGIDLAVFKHHNPWLLGEQLSNPDHKAYLFCVPKNLNIDYSGYLSDLLVEKENVNVEPSNSTKAAGDSTLAIKLYSVVINSETTLEDIARTYSLTIEDIRKWNKISETQKTVKEQTLVIQSPATK